MQDQISLIQSDWKQVMQDSDRSGTMLYTQLFMMRPSLKRLFGEDVHEQRRRLLLMMDSAVKSAEYLTEMGQQFHDLGRRHEGYGVTPEDFPIMEKALILMLRSAVGDAWDDRHENAWRGLFSKVERMMRGQPMTDPVNLHDS